MRKETIRKREVVAEIAGAISFICVIFIALWAYSMYADPYKLTLITHVPWQAVLALGIISIAGLVINELLVWISSEKGNLWRLRRKEKIRYTW